MRTIILIASYVLLLAAASCNSEASCTTCEGCSTITARITATDSLLFTQTLCTDRAFNQRFSDSVDAIMQAHQSAATTVSRKDTSFHCQNATPKGRDAGDYEANGWYCQYKK